MYKLTMFLQELCFITAFLHRYNKNGVTVIKFTLLCLTLLYFILCSLSFCYDSTV